MINRKYFATQAAVATLMWVGLATAAPTCPKGTTLNKNCWKCGDNCLAYSTDGKKLTITGTGKMDDFTEEFYSPNGHPAPWREYRKDGTYTSIVVEKGITHIGNYAFLSQGKVTSLSLPNTVTSIGAHAFSFMRELKSLTIPNSVKTVEHDAFLGAGEKITSLVIPDSVTYIGKRAFGPMPAVKELKIGNSVETIEFDSLPNSKLIKGTFKVPTSVTYIGGNIFAPTGITNIVMPLSDNPKQKYADFKDDIQVLFDRGGSDKVFNKSQTVYCQIREGARCAAFGNTGEGKVIHYRVEEGACCKDSSKTSDSHYRVGDLYYATIEDMVAGNSCGSTETCQKDLQCPEGTKLGKNCWKCGENCLAYSTDGKKLTITGTGKMDNYDLDFMRPGNTPAPWRKYLKKGTYTSIVVEKGITHIGNFAFVYQSGATSLSLPDTLKSIGVEAFYDMNNVTNLKIPNSVETIGELAFYGMNKVKSLIIPDSVKEIRRSAFAKMTGVKELKIGNSVKTIGESAFDKLSEVKGILKVPPSVTLINHYALRGLGVTDIVLPLSDHPAYRLGSYTDLAQMRLGSGVFNQSQTVYCQIRDGERCAFFGNTKEGKVIYYHVEKGACCKGSSKTSDSHYRVGDLYYATIEDMVAGNSCGSTETCQKDLQCPEGTTLNKNCWKCGENCLAYTSDGSKLTIIGTGETDNFNKTGAPWKSYLTKIKSLDVDEGITKIGNYAFRGATNLSSVSLPKSVVKFGSDVFHSTKKLKSIKLPEGMTSIGGWTFYGSGVTEVVVPAKATEVLAGAFDSSTLKKSTLPEGVTSIGYRAYRLTPIEDIVIPSTVKTIDEEAFSNVRQLKSITVYDYANLTINKKAFWQVDMSKVKVYCVGKKGLGDTKKCDAFFSKAGYKVSSTKSSPASKR